MDDTNDKEKSDSGRNSYRNILKNTSFFGGVQIFNIIITLIRGKFVAIILGPEGMGISALFNSASNTIQRLSSLGLPQAIVKDVADGNRNKEEKESVIRTSLGLSNVTAMIGLILCVAFCIPLSRITFGDASYWWQFMILGAGVFFAIAGTGKLSVLQGLHEVKRISKASLVGGLTGLGIGIPLYYIFGYKGIVPAIVAIFLALYVFYSISLKKSYSFEPTSSGWKSYWPVARMLLILGLVLMSGELISTLVGYLINLFVRIVGSIDDVGLYQAANSVTNQFAGVIFAVMAMEYFPRLSQIASDNVKVRETVNRQSEIVAWLMTPAMGILILSTPLLIRVLLSQEFHNIIPLMRWMGLGMLIRAFSFPMAYITYAKGNKKVFFIMEGIVANLVTLVLSCIFYYWFGIIGLGYAIVADNAFCFILYYIVNRSLYDYNFSSAALKGFTLGCVMVGSCFVFSFLESVALAYSLMGVMTAVAIIWSFLKLKSSFQKN